MKTRFLSATLLGSSLLLACSSDDGNSNSPPVISAITGSEETTAEGAFQVVEWDIAFTDADKDSVSVIRYKVAALNIDQQSQLQGANPNAVGVKLKLGFPGNTPKGPHQVAISVIDARGAESAAITKNVTVK